MSWLWVSLRVLPAALAAQAATVLPTKLVGSIDATAQSTLAAAVTQALREQHILDVASKERDAILTSEPKLAGCLTESCMERIGRLLDSQLVLRTQVTFHGSGAGAEGDWELRVDVFDVEVGAIGASINSDCRSCSAKRTAQTLSELVGRGILESASRPRGSLAISSVPASALVFVDGTELGLTPYKRLTFVGSHRIVVRSTGFRSYQGEVEIEESKKQPLSVTLQPGTDSDGGIGEKSATPIYKKWWFWALLGSAAVAAGGITTGILLSTEQSVPNGTAGPTHIHF